MYDHPPAEFSGQLGAYRSPLKFADGTLARSPAEWAKRRTQILETWHRRLLAAWPTSSIKPNVKRLETVQRDGYVQHHVHVQISTDGKLADGYLLIPAGEGPFPAVFVPFYEPLTSIGEGTKGRGTHDYGRQLVRRGFVTLSIGTPGSFEKIGADTRQLLVEAGAEQPTPTTADAAGLRGRQLPHGPGADAGSRSGASRHHRAVVRRQVVDVRRRVCMTSFSVRSLVRPGIVLDEKNANVNYWEARGIWATIPNGAAQTGRTVDRKSTHGTLQRADRRGG